MVGDGSYMMLNSEIATSVSLGVKLVIVVLDNHGFGCINRLQMETGGANFNNLWKDCAMVAQPDIDFAEHAESMGAIANKVASIGDLEGALEAAKAQRPHHGRRDRDPSADRHRGRRALVGRRSPRSFAAPRGDRGARRNTKPPAAGSGCSTESSPVRARRCRRRRRMRFGAFPRPRPHSRKGSGEVLTLRRKEPRCPSCA